MKKTIITLVLSMMVMVGLAQVPAKQDSVTVTIPTVQREAILKAIGSIYQVLQKSKAPYDETAASIEDLKFLNDLFVKAQPKKQVTTDKKK